MGDQLAFPANVSSPGTPEPDKMSRSSTYDYDQSTVNPERDAPEQFQVAVTKLKDQFNALDKEVRTGGRVIVRGIGQMIPALAKMEPFLSRKGEHHEPHRVRMLIAAGLPTWEDYQKQVAAEFEMSVRTVQRKLEEHRGHPKEQQPRRLSGGNGSVVARKARPKPVRADATRNLAPANSTSDNGMAINPTESDSACVRLSGEGFLIAARPVAEPEKIAAAPDKLGQSVGKLNAEPDWKHVLIELIAVLEQFGDRLPLVVLSKKCTIEKLLEGNDLPQAARKVSQHRAKRYQKPKKVDSEGNGSGVVKAKGEKETLETVGVKSTDDKAVAHLNSPATSLSDIGAASKMIRASVTHAGAESSGLHEGVA
jgi:hypothetical protein